MAMLLGPLGSEDGVLVAGMVDTGSDITIVPVSIVEAFNITPTGVKDVQAFNGTTEQIAMYPLRVRIDQIIDEEMSIGAFEGECLIGRDILRLLTTVLNGPISLLNAFR